MPCLPPNRLLLGLGLLLTACHPELIAPTVSPCPVDVRDTSSHPQANAYQAVLDRFVAEGIPGVVAAIHHPEHGLWVGAAGMASLEEPTLMRSCHRFPSASLAKTYHCVGTLALAEIGQLDLDAPIARYLPTWVQADLPYCERVQVSQLMNHTSGIPDYISRLGYLSDYLHDPTKLISTQEALSYVAGQSLDFAPGSDAHYSNTNTVLLALEMDSVYGDHARVISDFLIAPLGLQSTFYKQEPGYPTPAALVNTYVDWEGNGSLVNSSDYEATVTRMSIGHDGMIVSPVENVRFMQALFAGEIIGEPLVQRMLDDANERRGLGLGLFIDRFAAEGITRVGHPGATVGTAHEMNYYLESGLIICLSANFGGYVGGPLGKKFYAENDLGNETTLYGALERIALGR